jgi:tRNA 2-thiouridine synthesizing protein D
MRCVLLVKACAHGSQAARSAYNFARSACANGHRVTQVFFFADGVSAGNAYSVPPQDEPSLTRDWAELASEHDIPLLLCVSAAQRRGVLDSTEGKRLGIGGGNLAEGFALAGLGQFVEACDAADRVVSFNG